MAATACSPGLQNSGLDFDPSAHGQAEPWKHHRASQLGKDVASQKLRKYLGFPGGMLKDTDDLMAKASGLRVLYSQL